MNLEESTLLVAPVANVPADKFDKLCKARPAVFFLDAETMGFSYIIITAVAVPVSEKMGFSILHSLLLLAAHVVIIDPSVPRLA